MLLTSPMGFDAYRYRPRLILGVVGLLEHERKGKRLVDSLRDLPFVEIITTEGRMSATQVRDLYERVDYVLIPATVEGGPVMTPGRTKHGQADYRASGCRHHPRVRRHRPDSSISGGQRRSVIARSFAAATRRNASLQDLWPTVRGMIGPNRIIICFRSSWRREDIPRRRLHLDSASGCCVSSNCPSMWIWNRLRRSSIKQTLTSFTAARWKPGGSYKMSFPDIHA